MNKSQTYATYAFIATVISTICAAILPQLQVLPPSWKVVATVVSIISAAAAGLVTLFNQSASKKHVSISKRAAKQIVNQLPKSSVPEALKEQVKV